MGTNNWEIRALFKSWCIGNSIFLQQICWFFLSANFLCHFHVCVCPGGCNSFVISMYVCVQVDAIVFLVDSVDKERFSESKAELDALLSDDLLSSVPFLILGNKIDIPYAASEEELRYCLGQANCTTGKGKVNLADSGVRPIELFMCSIVRRMGYGDGFRWLSQYVK